MITISPEFKAHLDGYLSSLNYEYVHDYLRELEPSYPKIPRWVLGVHLYVLAYYCRDQGLDEVYWDELVRDSEEPMDGHKTHKYTVAREDYDDLAELFGAFELCRQVTITWRPANGQILKYVVE